MADNYRVYYRKGDLEIEVESTDKDYVDQKLASLISTQTTTAQQKPHPPRTAARKKSISREETETTKIDVAGVVSKIHNADNFTDIEKNILDKSAQLPRILLVCQFAHDQGYEYLTTGDIEAITDQLRIKIKSTNVANCIAENMKYFDAESVRKRGAIVPYKINRQGKIALDKFIAGDKP